MKNHILLLILLFPVLALGQTVKIKSDTVKSWDVMNELRLTWNLGLSEDGEEPAEIRTFNKFKSLFWQEAVIYNDINAFYNPKSLEDNNVYKTKKQYDSVENYAHDVVLQFKNLKIDTDHIRFYYDSISYGIINVTMTKEMVGTKRSEYIIDDPVVLAENLINFKIEKYHVEKDEIKKDSIVAAITNLTAPGSPDYLFQSKYELQIRMMKKGDTIKISSIRNRSILIPLDCTNDQDKDGVSDDRDRCRDDWGDFTALGCKDSDLDGVPDTDDHCEIIYGEPENEGCPLKFFTTRFEFSTLVGGQLNSVNLSMPGLDQLGYESVDQSLSDEGSISDPGLIPSIVLSADLAYYFNKSKRMGIALGTDFTTFKASYTIDETAVYTFKSSDGTNDYRRRITLLADSSSEDINYSIINVPLLFKYRYRSQKLTRDHTVPNWSVEFSGGPSFIMVNTKTTSNSHMNFEGIYQVDPSTHAFTYSPDFDPSSTWNVWLTGDSINGQSESPGANAVFAQLNSAGYDFALNKNVKSEVKNPGQTGFALNLGFDGCYKFDDKGNIGFKFGVNAIFASLPGKSDGFRLADKTSDSYNSIWNSQQNATYFALGLHAGFVFQW